MSQNKLFKKLIEVAQKTQNITKSGYNKAQRYQYSTEMDVINCVRNELFERGVFVFTSSEIESTNVLKGKEGKESLVTHVKTTHTFVDSETGEYYTVRSSGSGWDSTDKGVYKAITGANKYFLQKCFLIPSEDDPENDGANPSYTHGKGNNTKKPTTTGFGLGPKKVESKDKPREKNTIPSNGAGKLDKADFAPNKNKEPDFEPDFGSEEEKPKKVEPKF